jgi:hypothetical protein
MWRGEWPKQFAKNCKHSRTSSRFCDHCICNLQKENTKSGFNKISNGLFHKYVMFSTLTQWYTVFLQQLIFTQLVNKISKFMELNNSKHCVHKRIQMDPIQRKPNAVPILIAYLSKINLYVSSFLCPSLHSGFLSCSSLNNIMATFHFSAVCSSCTAQFNFNTPKCHTLIEQKFCRLLSMNARTVFK